MAKLYGEMRPDAIRRSARADLIQQ